MTKEIRFAASEKIISIIDENKLNRKEVCNHALEIYLDDELLIKEALKRLGVDLEIFNEPVNNFYSVKEVVKSGVEIEAARLARSDTRKNMLNVVNQLKKDGKAITKNALRSYKGHLKGVEFRGKNNFSYEALTSFFENYLDK